MLNLGYATAGSPATLYGQLPTFVDGSGTPANIGATTLAVVDQQGNTVSGGGVGAPTLTNVPTVGGTSVNGVYYVTVTITNLSAGTYDVVITAGSFGTPAISLVGQVIATFTVNAAGLEQVYSQGVNPALGLLSTANIGSVQVIVGGYADGEDPASLIGAAILEYGLLNGLLVTGLPVYHAGPPPSYTFAGQATLFFYGIDADGNPQCGDATNNYNLALSGSNWVLTSASDGASWQLAQSNEVLTGSYAAVSPSTFPAVTVAVAPVNVPAANVINVTNDTTIERSSHRSERPCSRVVFDDSENLPGNISSETTIET